MKHRKKDWKNPRTSASCGTTSSGLIDIWTPWGGQVDRDLCMGDVQVLNPWMTLSLCRLESLPLCELGSHNNNFNTDDNDDNSLLYHIQCGNLYNLSCHPLNNPVKSVTILTLQIRKQTYEAVKVWLGQISWWVQFDCGNSHSFVRGWDLGPQTSFELEEWESGNIPGFISQSTCQYMTNLFPSLAIVFPSYNMRILEQIILQEHPRCEQLHHLY